MQLRVRSSLVQSRDADSSSIYRLVTVALIQMTITDQRSWPETFEDRKRSLTYLADIVSGAVVPEPGNKLQAELSDLFPRRRSIHVYFTLPGLRDISHYIVLHRDAVRGVWLPSCRRVMNVGHTLKTGVHLTWDTDTPIASSPTLHKIIGGGTEVTALAHDLAHHFEIQRELTHCIVLSSMFTKPTDDIYHVRLSSGKVTVKLRHPLPDDPLTENIAFDILRTRANDSLAAYTKLRATIWGNIGEIEYAPRLPRHLCVQLKAQEPADISAYPPPLQTIIQEALFGRLVPLLGVSDGKKVSVYALTYSEVHSEPFLALITDRAKPASVSSLPLVWPVTHRPVYCPNPAFTRILRHLAFETDSPRRHHAHRFQSIRQCMWAFGYRSILGFDTAFDQFGMPLNQAQLQSLESLEKEFNQTNETP